MTTFRICEIFGSIDGEGLRTGELATFIRLAGCNLRCSYCDTCYSLKITDGEEMTLDKVMARVKEIGYKNITITGGEPLIHRNIAVLINKLCLEGYSVNIETNGAVEIWPYLDYENVILTMDYKSASSGEESKMNLQNLEKLREQDVLKFVVKKSDLEKIEYLLKNYEIKSYVYLSPVFEKIEPAQLVEFLKELHKKGYNTQKIRVQVQLHKIIWNPNKRGV